MKTTDKYISTISVEARTKRNEKSSIYYEEHKEEMQIKSCLNAYKRKWGEDCVDDYIKEHGNTRHCIDIIKQNTHRPLPTLKKASDI